MSSESAPTTTATPVTAVSERNPWPVRWGARLVFLAAAILVFNGSTKTSIRTHAIGTDRWSAPLVPLAIEGCFCVAAHYWRARKQTGLPARAEATLGAYLGGVSMLSQAGHVLAWDSRALGVLLATSTVVSVAGVALVMHREYDRQQTERAKDGKRAKRRKTKAGGAAQTGGRAPWSASAVEMRADEATKTRRNGWPEQRPLVAEMVALHGPKDSVGPIAESLGVGLQQARKLRARLLAEAHSGEQTSPDDEAA